MYCALTDHPHEVTLLDSEYTEATSLVSLLTSEKPELEFLNYLLGLGTE
jgi:hypothetical protein